MKVKKPLAAPKSSKSSAIPSRSSAISSSKKSSAAGNTKRGSALPLVPSQLSSPASREALHALEALARKERVVMLLRQALGDDTVTDKSKPRAASTTRDRSAAAADVAVATLELGVVFVLKECEVLATLQRMLFPEGLQSLFGHSHGLRPSTSAISLSSMDTMDDTTATSLGSGATDSKRGKNTPPNAREGSLLLLRALAETVGKPVEPYIITGFFGAALDECGSASSAVREAAEDTCAALMNLASPWAFPRLLCPMLQAALTTSAEWRVKYTALERFQQCATKTCPDQVNSLLPKLIPDICAQIFDTKPQVTKAATAALLAICNTCQNPDIRPAIPAIVKAMGKPADNYLAVEELMSTTFVAPVDASTLAILCPILARALKEKLALRKRAACLVIKNMSRLVESPDDVAPFGPLLVPELLKVSENVQFEEIRDAALEALQNLTKALGDAYDSSSDAKQRMDNETARVEAEQKRIQEEREREEAKEVERRQAEAEERRKYKEAMDAQRELDRIAEEDAKRKRIEDEKIKDQQARSTIGKDGKCQGCNFKKCPKTCVFYKG
jgi:hypothetical protein